MPTVFLTPPTYSDTGELLAFELENREFFEASINARQASYYSLDGVTQAIQAAIADANHDRGYQFLVRDEDSEIVGRINLREVRRDHFHSAQLGYRIAESAVGNGYASEAVRQALDLAFNELGLVRIEADTRADNAASVKVLARNGFVQYGHSRQSFQLGGMWHDRLHFERHADPRPASAPDPWRQLRLMLLH